MMTPQFKPVYETNETVTTPVTNPASGQTAPVSVAVNPQYCLSLDSASQLASILREAYPQYHITMELADPQVFSSISPDFFNLKVPWITITNPGGGQDGADQVYPFNCGQFSDYWASAQMAAAGQYRDPEIAWRSAQQDISLGLSYQG